MQQKFLEFHSQAFQQNSENPNESKQLITHRNAANHVHIRGCPKLRLSVISCQLSVIDSCRCRTEMRSQWPKVWAIWLLPMKSFQLCDTKYSLQHLWLDLRDRKLRGKKLFLRKKAIHVYSKRISKNGLRKRQENWKQASFARVSLNTCFQTQTSWERLTLANTTLKMTLQIAEVGSLKDFRQN